MPAHPSQRIVVTGVSRGLGFAMTAGFIEAGHTVFGRAQRLVDRRASRCAGRPRITSSGSTWPTTRPSSPLGRGDLGVLGAVDLLVNNAALINRNAPLWQVPADEFSRVIDVNIKGVANVIRHFAPSMMCAAPGVIVNFSSGWGRSTSAEVAPVLRTKWAIEGLSAASLKNCPTAWPLWRQPRHR